MGNKPPVFEISDTSQVLPLICQDCQQEIIYPDLHYCSCGQRSCGSCYSSHHAAHDTHDSPDHRSLLLLRDDQEHHPD